MNPNFLTPFFHGVVSLLPISPLVFMVDLYGSIYFFTSAGFGATILSMLYEIALNLHYDGVTIFRYLTILEDFLKAINEWGFVYINYIKIRSCLRTLKKTYWKVIMFGLLLYNLCIRSQLFLLHYKKRSKEEEFMKKGEKYMKPEDYYRKQDVALALIYFPLGTLCAIFIAINIKELIHESENESKTNINILLRSNLSRMLLVTIVFISFIGISITTYIKMDDFIKFIRFLLWRIKENLGVIFLIDLLLLRIDLDINHMNKQNEELYQQQLPYPMAFKNSSNMLNSNFKRDRAYMDYSNDILSSQHSAHKFNPSNDILSSQHSIHNKFNPSNDIEETFPLNSYSAPGIINLNDPLNKSFGIPSEAKSNKKKKNKNNNNNVNNNSVNSYHYNPNKPLFGKNANNSNLPNEVFADIGRKNSKKYMGN